MFQISITRSFFSVPNQLNLFESICKVHVFWEGNTILQNLHLTFVLCSASKKHFLRRDLKKINTHSWSEVKFVFSFKCLIWISNIEQTLMITHQQIASFWRCLIRRPSNSSSNFYYILKFKVPYFLKIWKIIIFKILITNAHFEIQILNGL